MRGLRRELKPPPKKSVDLSSNDYLGLANHSKIKDAMCTEIEQNGCGATGSRLLRGERPVFTRLEEKFAAFKQTEKSLFFNSGYAANIGVLTTFLEPGDVVFSDELNHASIIDGLRLAKAARVVFPHNNVEVLQKLIDENQTAGQRFLIVESLFSMDGDFAPLKSYAKICAETNMNLIVDEAHAIGIYGENGSGLIEQFGIQENVFLSINTTGKALGISGASVAGKSWAIEYLIQRARSFIFSTAAPPSIAAGLIAALEIVQMEPERRLKLLDLSAFLRKLLVANEISVSPVNSQIIPIAIGASDRAVALASKLQNANFDVRAIRPPTVPPNTARLRVSLNSDLEKRDLANFVEVLKENLKDNN